MNFNRYKFVIDEYKAGNITREEFCRRWEALQDLDRLVEDNQ